VSTFPKISVLLPNLNHRKYLDERINSIFSQTLKNWELIVVDSQSDDGAWEFIQEIAKTDSRVRTSQDRRNGMYASWNNCVAQAKGEYVYFATSDDTMTPDCLEIMADALDAHPECDIAHCCLTVIDENGNPVRHQWKDFPKVRFYGDLIHRMHIRRAPYDGYVHAGWSTVYTSITQLLLRTSLFRTIGGFRNDFGSIADFEWEMGAALLSDVLHVPQYLATWRKHPAQATQDQYFETAAFSRDLISMVESAFRRAKGVNPNFTEEDLDCLQHVYKRQLVSRSLREAPVTGRWTVFNQFLKEYPWETYQTLISRLSMKALYQLDIESVIRSILRDRGLDQNIVVL
jgi:glycosyltransferase involved in cell wall biosynthesis